jgi:hypothetical protein
MIFYKTAATSQGPLERKLKVRKQEGPMKIKRLGILKVIIAEVAVVLAKLYSSMSVYVLCPPPFAGNSCTNCVEPPISQGPCRTVLSCGASTGA